jgi:hypothetical protein
MDILSMMLIMLISNPVHGGTDAYVIDHDMSAYDCHVMKADFDVHDNPNVEFSCEPQDK